MRVKLVVLLVGISVLTMILLTGPQSVIAAPPTGEVKTVTSMLGNEIPIPYLEMTHGNDWLQLLYDPLVGTTPEGKFSPEFGIANKWEMSKDGRTWTFYLRKGVKFHNGVELTAKDAKFSIEQHMLPDSKSDYAPVLRKTLKSIEVKDSYTLVITCNEPAIFLDSLLSYMEVVGLVVPKDYYEKVGRHEFAKRPIGTGPYKWHSQITGSFIKLEATDRHWRDGVPKYKYMTYLVIPEESTRMAMLKTGEADIARITRDSMKEAVESGLNIITKENAVQVHFHPTLQWESPFGDIRFRKALNLAIDKEAIIKQIFSGLAKPVACFPGANISVVGGPMLKPYPYAPQEARRLVKEGGWEGYEVTLMSYPRPGCPEYPQLVEVVAGYWEKVGLKIKIRMSEWPVWRLAVRERKTQNTVHGFETGVTPEAGSILTRLQEYFSGKSNSSQVNSPELNAMFERAEKSVDIEETSKLLVEIYRYLYDHYVMVPICELPDLIATTKRIPKWNPGLRRGDRNYSDLIGQR